MSEQLEIAATVDYLGGMSIEATSKKHGISRGKLVGILRRRSIHVRTASESRRMLQSQLTPAQRAANTQAARSRYLESRQASRRQAQVVRTWCEQRTTPGQEALIKRLGERCLQAKAYFPAGDVNIWVSVPLALVAIVPLPARCTAASQQGILEQTRYLTARGYFVCYMDSELDPGQLDTIEAMCRSRMGWPVDLTAKAKLRESLAPHAKTRQRDYDAAVRLAHELYASEKAAYDARMARRRQGDAAAERTA